MGTIDPVGSANALAANDALRLLALQLVQRSTTVLQTAPPKPQPPRRVEGVGGGVDVQL